MEQKISLDQGVETPILIKQGIECKALQLDTGGDQNFAILLDNVSDEWAPNLPTDFFLKLGPNRYISTKPIANLNWGAFFPGTKTQYTQPTQIKASKVGRTVGVPPEVQDQIKAWSEDHIKTLIQTSGDVSYVASYDVYRHSSIQGHIEKTYVPIILEAATETVLSKHPHAIHLIAFLNELYRESGQSKSAEVDTSKVFEFLKDGDRYSDESITGALPAYLSRNERLVCWVDKQQLIVVIFNTASQSLNFHQFSDLAGCYRFCNQENLTNACTEKGRETLLSHLDSYRKRWPWSIERTALIEIAEADGSRYCAAGSRRFIYDSEDKDHARIYYADPDSRSIFTWIEETVSAYSTGASQWLTIDGMTDPDLRYLIWGVTDQREEINSTDSVAKLTYPPAQISKDEWHDVTERRRLIAERYWSDLYNFTSDQRTLAQRVILVHFLKLTTPGFIRDVQSQMSVERFCGAVEFVFGIVGEFVETDLTALLGRVLSRLEVLGLLDSEKKETGLVSALTDRGKGLMSDLQCTSIDKCQRVVRIFCDLEYQKQHLYPYMYLNWPYEHKWWVYGFDFFMEDSGWSVARQGQRYFQRLKSREEALQAVKKHVIHHRLKQLDSGWYYYSKRWLRYQVPEDFNGSTISGIPDVLHERPEKTLLKITPVENGFGQIAVTYNSDVEASVSDRISSAFHDLSGVLGIPKELVTFNGQLCIHAAGDGAIPEIALWTDDTMAHCSYGGIAAAWAEVLYSSLVGDQQPYEIYFPAVSDPDLQRLLNAIQEVDKPFAIAAAWFDLEREVIEEIRTVYGFEPEGSIGSMAQEDFSGLLTALDSKESMSPLISRVLRLRANTGLDNRGDRSVFSQFVSSSRQYADLWQNRAAVQGRSLFARAFEAWVEDALDASGVVNDALVYGTHNEDRLGFDIYPAGGDRFRIGCAFDQFFFGKRNGL